MSEVEELKELATLARQSGDSDLELKALEKLNSIQDNNFMGSGIIEPALAIGSSLATTTAGGLAGIAQTLNPFAEEGAGAKAVQSVQSKTFQPKTQAGQQNLENIGSAVQFVIDKFNIPTSGIGGIVELISGQGLDQAVKTIENIQSEGFGKTVGDRVFEETGSPLASTAAFMSPDIASTLTGAKAAQAGAQAALKPAKETSKSLALVPQSKALVPQAVEKTKELAKTLFEFQTPAKREIAKLLDEGSTFEQVGGFELITKRKIKDPTGLQKFFDVGGPKAKAIPEAKEAIRQGWDRGVIAPVQSASRADSASMLKMVELAERVKSDRLFAMENRPSDIAGDTLMTRLNTIRRANRSAGFEINKAANNLRKQEIDVIPASQQFKQDLSDMGIKISKDLDSTDFEINFKGSDIEGLKGPENAIKNIFKRMTGPEKPTAYDVHRLKRFIDEQVTYGKNAEGLAGKAELTLKSLRRNLDGLLDSKFDDYRIANETYADTISALDAFQDVAGRKMNLTGDNADKATGTLMRRLMGNAQSRVRLLDSLREIEEVAKKHAGFGGPLKIKGKVDPEAEQNLFLQVLFADEIDTIIGPAQRTSLQAEFDKTMKKAFAAVSTKSGAADVGIDAVANVAKKAQGINEKNALKSIKALLQRKSKNDATIKP